MSILYSLLLLLSSTYFIQSNEEVRYDALPIPELPLEDIQLPDGFKIEIFASVENARSMAMSPSGILYVGNRSGDKVYAVIDEDGDFVADKQYVIDSGLRMPNGVAFLDGDLYVGAVSKILKYPDIESNLTNPPDPTVIYDKYPTEGHHGWKYIAFGPDGKLYVPVGAPCNICKPEDDVFASITRINPDGTDMEIYASGVRNSVGFTWHPETKALWFTDNGRDQLGDDVPPCELNSATRKGQNFGYPYCHAGTVLDPEFGDGKDCDDYISPALSLGAHVAPLGLKFYTGNQFPSPYHGTLLIAEHGSWNRSKKSGYRLVNVPVDGNKGTAYNTFASGWLNDESQEVWGRPVDVLVLPDGSILVSDDFANVIYRISYEG